MLVNVENAGNESVTRYVVGLRYQSFQANLPEITRVSWPIEGESILLSFQLHSSYIPPKNRKPRPLGPFNSRDYHFRMIYYYYCLMQCKVSSCPLQQTIGNNPS